MLWSLSIYNIYSQVDTLVFFIIVLILKFLVESNKELEYL